jgi:hypothetical protein
MQISKIKLGEYPCIECKQVIRSKEPVKLNAKILIKFTLFPEDYTLFTKDYTIEQFPFCPKHAMLLSTRIREQLNKGV